MLDVLLFLGGKTLAKNSSSSDLVREEPRAKLVGGVANRVNIGRKLGYTDSQIQKLICKELQIIREELLKGLLKVHS